MIVKGGHFGNARVRMTGAKAKVRSKVIAKEVEERADTCKHESLLFL